MIPSHASLSVDEIARLLAPPFLLVPVGAEISIEELMNSVGSIVIYDADTAPERLN